MKRGKKMIPAQVRSDKDTIAKLKVLSGGHSVAKLLRDLAAGSPPPASTIEEKLDKILNNMRVLHNMVLTLMDIRVMEVPGLTEKIEASGISVWTAEMYDEILGDPSLLDNKEWLEAHQDKPADMCDIDNWKKEFEE